MKLPVINLPILGALFALVFLACTEGRGGGGSETEQCFPSGSVEAQVIIWSSRVGMVATLSLLALPVLFIFSGLIDSYIPGAGKFIRKHSAWIGVSAATTLISCIILAHTAPYLWWIAVGVAVIGLVIAGYLFWKNVRKVEKTLGVDINGDGRVG